MENQTHILRAFDRDLEGIQASIMKMGGLVEAAISDAAKALETRDAELAGKVRAGDKPIDALEHAVNEDAARILALRQPIAGDLRTVLTVFRLSGALERMGDYAKNIAKRTGVLMEMDEIEGTTKSLRRMARLVELMLKDALDAYAQHPKHAEAGEILTSLCFNGAAGILVFDLDVGDGDEEIVVEGA